MSGPNVRPQYPGSPARGSYYAAIGEATRGPIAAATAGDGDGICGLGENDALGGALDRFILRFVCARL